MREHSWKSATETVLGVFTESREFVSSLILNFALVLGVIVFEWSLVEIAVIYFAEVAIVHLFFLVVALFTPQPVDDRDGDAWNAEPTPFQPISLLPPVYLTARVGILSRADGNSSGVDWELRPSNRRS